MLFAKVPFEVETPSEADPRGTNLTDALAGYKMHSVPGPFNPSLY